ncbi:MAG TPA: hypothetical protein VLR49_12595 [Ferruginibacter sp.]|nr:hypothetical protein [Ferruginibacter sp.]
MSQLGFANARRNAVGHHFVGKFCSTPAGLCGHLVYYPGVGTPGYGNLTASQYGRLWLKCFRLTSKVSQRGFASLSINEKMFAANPDE